MFVKVVMYYVKLCVLFVALFGLGSAFASHKTLWENTIQLGGSAITGNSPATTVTGKFTSAVDIDYPESVWGYNFLLEGRRATALGIESARFYRSEIEGRYLFSTRDYAYGKLNYTFNAFDTYDMVVRDSIGVGRILINDQKQKLSLEGGPGSTHQRIAGSEMWQTQLIAHAESNYLLHVSQNGELTQNFIVDAGRLNSHLQSISAIRTKVMSNLDMQLSFEMNHYTKIAQGSKNTKKTDTLTNITFIYCFHA